MIKTCFLFDLDAGAGDPETHPSQVAAAAEAEKHAIVDPASMAVERMGFAPVYEKGPMLMNVERTLVVRIAIRSRVVPPAAVKKAVAERAAAFEQSKGFAPGKKLMRDLKEQVIAEMLPRAFISEKSYLVFLDRQTGGVIVEGSIKIAEAVVSYFRNIDIAMPVVPWTANIPGTVSTQLTGWLNGEDLRSGWALGSDAELESAGDRVRFKNHDLGAPEIRAHIDDGFYALSCALSEVGKSTFTLDDKGAVKSIGLPGLLDQQAEASGGVDEQFQGSVQLTMDVLRKVPTLFAALAV